MCDKFDVVGLLETHGSTRALEQMLAKALKTHVLVHSPYLNKGNVVTDTGGVASLISKSLLGTSPQDPSFCNRGLLEILVHGRVIRVNVPSRNAGGWYPCYFGHNHGSSKAQVLFCCKRIDGDIHKSKVDPTKFGLCLLADLNFEAEGEERFYLERPDEDNEASSSDESHQAGSETPLRQHQRVWERTLSKPVEVKVACQTHFIASQSAENRIDRIFTSTPRSALVLLSHRCGVTKPPEWWYTRNLSDHAPPFWSVSIPKSAKEDTMVLQLLGCSHNPRIPTKWARHPLYKKRCEAMTSVLKPELLSTEQFREHLCEIHHDAAMRVRDFLFVNDPHSNECSLMRLSSIGRASWSNDLHLARLLILNSDLGREHLIINGTKVGIKDSEKIEGICVLRKFVSMRHARRKSPRNCKVKTI